MNDTSQPEARGRALTRPRRLLRRVARRLWPQRWAGWPVIGSLLGVGVEYGHIVDGIDGLRIEYSLDSVIGQLLFLEGGFEASESAFMATLLSARRDAVVLDVGANIGLHSLRAARLNPVARVFAFEPGRSTHAMLRRNVGRNACGAKVIPLAFAVAAQSGEAQFHYCADDAYSSLTPDYRRPVEQTYPVSVVSLDDWTEANAVNRIDLVKIDVEGGEPGVIAGASRTLGRSRPDLVIEIFQGTRRDFSATDLIDSIRRLRYDAFVLVDGQPVPYTAHNDAHFNYHFAPQ